MLFFILCVIVWIFFFWTFAEGESRQTVQEHKKHLTTSYEDSPVERHNAPGQEITAVRYYQIHRASDKEIIEEIYRVFGEKVGHSFVRIAKCESGLREKVISPTNDIGVAQINLSAHGNKISNDREKQIEYFQNYKNNISFAYTLYQERGFAPWKYSSRCHGQKNNLR